MASKTAKSSAPRRVDTSPLLLVEDHMLTVPAFCKAGTSLTIPSDDLRILELVRVLLQRAYQPILDAALVKIQSETKPAGKNKKKNKNEDTSSELESIRKVLVQMIQFTTSNSPKVRNLLKDWAKPKCSFAVAQAITEMAFGFAIPSAKKLNSHYESFSSETYGETSLEQMKSIIDELNLGPEDVLVDMGSGVGQLVCFTAAYANIKKTVGIELESVPAGYSETLSAYFKKLVSHFGKTCGEFELYAGDFLHKDFDNLIFREATVIFINNYAFSPNLMNRIVTERLQFLNDGVRIVTSKPLSNHRQGMSFRNQNDISALTDTTPLKSVQSNVSWTNKTVAYTLQTMNSMKILQFYEQSHQKALDKKNKTQSRKRKISDN